MFEEGLRSRHESRQGMTCSKHTSTSAYSLPSFGHCFIGGNSRSTLHDTNFKLFILCTATASCSMPSAVTLDPPIISKWKRSAPTKKQLDWADMKTIDLSNFDSPGVKQKLAEELRDAVHTTGFFSVVGTGLTQQEVDRQYDIGQAYFDLPFKEKGDVAYRCDFANGNYFGYRAACEKKIMGTDVLDNVESVNIPKFILANEHEPFHPYLRQFQREIEDFTRRSLDSASKIFTLFSIILELPEDYFSRQHAYGDPSEGVGPFRSLLSVD